MTLIQTLPTNTHTGRNYQSPDEPPQLGNADANGKMCYNAFLWNRDIFT